MAAIGRRGRPTRRGKSKKGTINPAGNLRGGGSSNRFQQRIARPATDKVTPPTTSSAGRPGKAAILGEASLKPAKTGSRFTSQPVGPARPIGASTGAVAPGAHTLGTAPARNRGKVGTINPAGIIRGSGGQRAALAPAPAPGGALSGGTKKLKATSPRKRARY